MIKTADYDGRRNVMKKKKSYKNRKKFSSLVIGACCAAMIVPCTLLPVFPGTAEVYAAQEFEGDVPGWDNLGVYTRSGDWGYMYYGDYTENNQRGSLTMMLCLESLLSFTHFFKCLV